MHLTCGILRHFRAFSTPEQNPALRVLSTPTHPQVTQTVDAVGNVCQLVNNNFLITSGKVVKINDNSLEVEIEFNHSTNADFPQGSDISSNYIFITQAQEDRILILEKQE